MSDRIEVIVERWGNRDKSTDYRWSVWRAGTRVQMGGPHASAEDSERDAVEFCRKEFQRAPDRIERPLIVSAEALAAQRRGRAISGHANGIDMFIICSYTHTLAKRRRLAVQSWAGRSLTSCIRRPNNGTDRRPNSLAQRSCAVNFLYMGLFLRFKKLRSQFLTYA